MKDYFLRISNISDMEKFYAEMEALRRYDGSIPDKAVWGYPKGIWPFKEVYYVFEKFPYLLIEFLATQGLKYKFEVGNDYHALVNTDVKLFVSDKNIGGVQDISTLAEKDGFGENMKILIPFNVANCTVERFLENPSEEWSPYKSYAESKLRFYPKEKVEEVIDKSYPTLQAIRVKKNLELNESLLSQIASVSFKDIDRTIKAEDGEGAIVIINPYWIETIRPIRSDKEGVPMARVAFLSEDRYFVDVKTVSLVNELKGCSYAEEIVDLPTSLCEKGAKPQG